MEDQAEKIEAYLSGRGDYMITVWAEDAYGNRTVDSMIFNLAITGINTNMRESLVFYPNPSQDVLYFNAEKDNQLAKIYASNGSLVKTIDLPAQQKSLRIHDLPNGLYVLQIGNKQAKFIKE
jgi:Secretion system C-terminal sorting domain